MTDREYLERYRPDLAERGRLLDFSTTWAAMTPVADTIGVTRRTVERFCASKRFTLDALAATGARYVHAGHYTEIAWAYPARDHANRVIVPAIKYRRVDGDHARRTPKGARFAEPLVIDHHHAARTLICEGETDAARLWGMFGDRGDCVQVLALPAGIGCWRSKWVKWIPAGATVYLAVDGDEPGEQGARRIAAALWAADPPPADVRRLRPPGGAKDWCAA